MPVNKISKYGRLIIRIAIRAMLVFILFFAAVTFALQFSSVQTWVTGKVTSWLHSETGAVISIDRVAVRFPRQAGLEGIYIEDAHGDTLVSAGSIYARVRMTALLRNRIHIGTLRVNDLKANISRDEPDTLFNWQVIASKLASAGNTGGDKQASGNTLPDTEGDRPAEAENNGGMGLTLKKVKLENIEIGFRDHLAGIIFNGKLDLLETDLGGSDLLNGIYQTGNTLIDGGNINLITSEPAVSPAAREEDATLPDLQAGPLTITRFTFGYSGNDGSSIYLELGNFGIIPGVTDLAGRTISIRSLDIGNVHSEIRLPASPEPDPDSENAIAASLDETYAPPLQSPQEKNIDHPDNGQAGRQNTPAVNAAPSEAGGGNNKVFSMAELTDWIVDVGRLTAGNVNMIYDTGSGQPAGIFDPGNFSFQDLGITAHDIYIGPDTLSIELKEMSAVISDTFRAGRLSLSAFAGSAGGSASLDFETPHTEASMKFSTRLPATNFSESEIWDSEFSLEIEKLNPGHDLLFFLPQSTHANISPLLETRVTAGGSVTGTPSRFTVKEFFAGAEEVFNLKITGTMSNVARPEYLHIDTADIEMLAFPERVAGLLPAHIELPETYTPEKIRAFGTFTGSLTEFVTAVGIESDMGDLEASLSLTEDDGEQHYTARIYSPAIDAGRLSGNLAAGSPSFLIDITGRGLEPAGAEAQVSLLVSGLIIAEHDYDDINIEMNLADSVVHIDTRYSDEIVSGLLNAEIGIFKKIPFAKGELAIDYANMMELGASEDEILVTGNLEADIIFSPQNFFSGYAGLTGLNIATPHEMFSIPEITVISESEENNYSLAIESEIIKGDYTGNVNPLDIPSILAGHLTSYFALPDTPARHEINGEETFQVTADLFPDHIVNMMLLPGIDKYDTLSLSVSYDGEHQNIRLSAGMDELGIGGAVLRNIAADIVSDAASMDFSFSSANLAYEETGYSGLEAAGSLSGNKLNLSLSMNDMNDNVFLYAGLLAETIDTLYHISLDDEKLVLAGASWNIDERNIIIAGKEYLDISNFQLSHGTTSITASTRKNTIHATILSIDIQNAELSSLAGYTGSLIPVTSGTLNGRLNARDIFGEPGLTMSADINEMTIAGEMIERINLLAESEAPGHYLLNASVRHRDGTLRARGSVRQNEEEMPVDASIFLDNLDLSFAGPFAAGNLTHLEGTAEGEVRLTGTVSEPVINGGISITGAAFRVPALNAGYFIKEERVDFDRHQLVLSGFTLHDSLGRTASVNGNVDYTDFGNLMFNLGLSTRNFMLMNLDRTHNDLYHGRLLMDSDLRLRGSHRSPSLEGRIRFNEGSAFTFIVPRTAPDAIGDEGVVEFIVPEKDDFLVMAADIAETAEITSSLERTEVSLNIELDRQSEIRIVIDDFAGDHLVLKGGGVLSFGIDQGGMVNLSGRYEIAEGEYLLTFYDVIRRNFRIRQGSSIMWTGDPLDAEMDITAIYSVRTSARELMRAHIPAGQGDAAGLRQQFPFQVSLNMKGNLMSPDINFELDMPPEHRQALDGSLMARVNEINRNESELNKQVFALLILGGFLPENPLAAADAGGGFTSAARTSASQVLSQQLNRMSDRYIRGLDISFEIESYEDYVNETAAGRTELQMEVSRDFMDERIRVRVGGNIELEDETRRRTGAGDIAGDFSLEYLLTPEGNIILKGFRTRDYGDLVEPDITKTGVSVMFSRSYNNIRELFRRREDEEVE